MFVSPKYLDRFKLTFPDEASLFALSPSEIPLHGFEQTGNAGIGLDAPPGGEYPEVVGILYQDTNPDNAEMWELEQSKRKTFVTIPGHPIGYMFDGLLAQPDVRLWFRNKFNIPEPVVVETASYKAMKAAEAAVASAEQVPQ